jgi:hypothetical protein
VDCLIADRTDGVSSGRYPIVDTLGRSYGVSLRSVYRCNGCGGADLCSHSWNMFRHVLGTTFGFYICLLISRMYDCLSIKP